jgi:hypothetical protein
LMEVFIIIQEVTLLNSCGLSQQHVEFSNV